MGTVLVEAEKGGAAQQQRHRSASKCAETPRRGAVKGVRCARLGVREWAVACGLWHLGGRPCGRAGEGDSYAARFGVVWPALPHSYPARPGKPSTVVLLGW